MGCGINCKTPYDSLSDGLPARYIDAMGHDERTESKLVQSSSLEAEIYRNGPKYRKIKSRYKAKQKATLKASEFGPPRKTPEAPATQSPGNRLSRRLTVRLPTTGTAVIIEQLTHFPKASYVRLIKESGKRSLNHRRGPPMAMSCFVRPEVLYRV